MDGADLQTSDHVRRPACPASTHDRAAPNRGDRRVGWIWLLPLLVSVSFILVQCGRAPSAGMLAANAPASSGDSFDDRFPAAGFGNRLASADESFVRRHPPEVAASRAAQSPRPPYRVASLTPEVPDLGPSREPQTTLVSLNYSAFPYLGKNPRTDEPFLNISQGDRRGHRSSGGRIFWQDQTFNDSRTLIHVPAQFDLRKPGFIVVFFHGNGATLERDVRDRQLVPQQVSDSGVNAVLLAPQLAVDAADSSAGKFWQPGGLKRFVDESAEHLARLYGDPGAAKSFANLPVIIIGYSGGFVPTAWSLEVGGLGNRVRGVFLLDAVYGELDKFASWIVHNRNGFFVSSYTRYTKRHDQELIQMLREKGITVADEVDGPLRPGSVVFVQTPDGITHRDYVTHAFADQPIREVLARMAPTVTRIASGDSVAASR